MDPSVLFLHTSEIRCRFLPFRPERSALAELLLGSLLRTEACLTGKCCATNVHDVNPMRLIPAVMLYKQSGYLQFSEDCETQLIKKFKRCYLRVESVLKNQHTDPLKTKQSETLNTFTDGENVDWRGWCLDDDEVMDHLSPRGEGLMEGISRSLADMGRPEMFRGQDDGEYSQVATCPFAKVLLNRNGLSVLDRSDRLGAVDVVAHMDPLIASDFAWVGQLAAQHRCTTSWITMDLSQEDEEAERTSLGERLGEKTQGIVNEDPNAAYNLASCLGGWIIPAKEKRRCYRNSHLSQTAPLRRSIRCWTCRQNKSRFLPAYPKPSPLGNFECGHCTREFSLLNQLEPQYCRPLLCFLHTVLHFKGNVRGDGSRITLRSFTYAGQHDLGARLTNHLYHLTSHS
ncbi:hypothetical protein CCH79_00010923 [Gambusia affinis]|uniref:Uncharacterized protein n=1 Tax=Gambusia affinis TaxID=33528 RepID=A0A315VNG0_GAMAF|nr:hypothetical protein CCH79_00010923 [Gambusia affinis]